MNNKMSVLAASVEGWPQSRVGKVISFAFKFLHLIWFQLIGDILLL